MQLRHGIIMKVTIIQTDIKWQETSKNQADAEALILGNIGSDVYVLPEMWSTGFVMQANKIAEDESETNGSIVWMHKMAQRTNAAICGTLAIKTNDGKYLNRMFFVKPNGEYIYYDKRHLFTPGGECTEYSAGKQRKVVEFRGIRFMLAICYDLRFPVWLRNRKDYDVIICPANWPASRHKVWQTLLKARAIENQCYVIGANRTGNDPQCKYNGGSSIVNPYGKVIAEADASAMAISATVNMEFLQKFRDSFPVLNDRDEFELIDKQAY